MKSYKQKNYPYYDSKPINSPYSDLKPIKIDKPYLLSPSIVKIFSDLMLINVLKCFANQI